MAESEDLRGSRGSELFHDRRRLGRYRRGRRCRLQARAITDRSQQIACTLLTEDTLGKVYCTAARAFSAVVPDELLLIDVERRVFICWRSRETVEI
ncbi:MAG: hypothetical protein GY937_20490 [bacterium]|nr:hypothetical protein [bacterium]